MVLQVKLLTTAAKAPFKAHSSDAGFDLFCDSSITLVPGTINKVSTGVSVRIPEGYYGRIAPRSGLAVKHGVDVLAGVVDSGYRGELKIIMTTLEQVEFEVGSKVAQLVIEKIMEGNEVQVVDELDETDRGEGGFGSTGK